MLILTRRVSETLMINSDITVTVVATKGNQVRLGIIAPADVAIHRRELYDKITEERKGQGIAGTAASVSLAKGETPYA